MFSLYKLAPFWGIMASVPSVIAGFNSASQSNIAVYWGKLIQNRGKTSPEFELTWGQGKIHTVRDPELMFSNAFLIIAQVSLEF